MLFATTNSGKAAEVEQGLRKYGISMTPLSDQYPPDPALVESGETFFENARLKALHYNNKYGLPTLADDSGLIIPALDNMPGVHSSRFLGEQTGYEEKMAAIIKMLAEIPDADRTAYFACTMVFAMDGRVVSHFEKKVFGQIAMEPRGRKGFGYDPIFFIADLNRTFAEIDGELKNSISHRGKAVETFVHLLETHPSLKDQLQ